MDSLEALGKFISQVGLPAALCVGFCVINFLLGRSLVRGHLKNLDAQTATLPTIGATLTLISDNQAKIAEQLKTTCRAKCDDPKRDGREDYPHLLPYRQRP